MIDKTNKKLILGIETSCDETAAAVVAEREILSNVVSSQIDIHKLYGGVVPEVASRNHTLAISNVVKQAIDEAGISFEDLDAVAVTYGAGLLGALLIGVSYAKALSYSIDKPLIRVNHITGHIAANYLTNPTLEPPFMCLLVSGGHTAIIEVNGYNKFRVIGQTLDDAAGEAFDKVARLLGLGYPGGPEIEKMAQGGKINVPMPEIFKGANHYNFSYSGLKTAVMNYINKANMIKKDIVKRDIAASFQKTAIDMLVKNTINATREYKHTKIVIAGGVGANNYLREEMTKRAEDLGIKTYYPDLSLCTDNASMIACQAYYMLQENIGIANLSLDAEASIKLSDLENIGIKKA